MNALVIINGKVEERDGSFVSSAWSGRNEQYDEPIPVEGFMLFDVDLNTIWMRQIYVAKSERQKGWGTILFKHLHEIGKRERCKSVKIHTTTSKKEPFGILLGRLRYHKIEDNLFFRKL